MKKTYTFIFLLCFIAFNSRAQQGIVTVLSADESDAVQQNNKNADVHLNKSFFRVQPNTNEKISSLACDSITTTFVSNNGLAGAMFDVVADTGINIFGMYSNFSLSGTYELYYKTGTFVGFENNGAAWTFLDSTAIITPGPDIPVFVTIPFNISLPAGDTLAFYLTNNSTTTFGGLKYTDGTAVGNIYVDNGELKILEGIGITYPFNNIYTPRIWNGILNYCTLATGINEQLPAASVSIAPNPVLNETVFNFGNISKLSLSLINLLGEKVFEEKNIPSASYVFKRNGLNSGIYFYEIFSKNNSISKGKLVLQ